MRRLPFGASADASAAVAAALEVRAAGGVILLPTETFYGLGCDPGSDVAVARVYALKGRPAGIPLPVLCADWDQVNALVEVPERHRVQLSRSWPGPLTAVLSARRRIPAGGGLGTLAVRMPGHPLLRALLYRVGPLTGTSANRHGSPPSVRADDAAGTLSGAPDLVLDGGPTPGGSASTLVDLSGPEPLILRPGMTAWI